MGRKKICIITTTSITIRCFLIEQLTFLTSHGYDVTVVCDRDVSLNKDLPANIRYEAKILRKPIIVTNFSTVQDQIQHKINGCTAVCRVNCTTAIC